MKRAKNFLGIGLQIFLFGTMTLIMIIVLNSLISGQRPIPQPTYQSFNPAYPAPSEPYPPPGGTRQAPALTVTPTLTQIPSTPTPFPITPFPTLTLQPGPSPTLIPTIGPAKNAAGSLYFVAKVGKDVNPMMYAMSMDATGKSLSEPARLSDDSIPNDGFIFPSADRNRLAITGSWGAFNVYNLTDGKIEQKANGLSPEIFFNWFPDNRQILYRGGATLVLADVISKKHTTLVVSGFGAVTAASASPDGQYVVYSFSQDSLQTPGLWINDTDGQNPHLLTQGPLSITNIAWSPDGKRIAFFSGGWQVVDSDGSDLREISSGISLPQCYFLPPLWSPDSRTLTVVTSRTGESFCNGWGDTIFKETNIVLIDIESGKARPLLPDGSTGNIDPTWSPDGSQMAFVSIRNGSPEIWIIKTDGSELRQLTENNSMVRFPVWQRAQP